MMQDQITSLLFPPTILDATAYWPVVLVRWGNQYQPFNNYTMDKLFETITDIVNQALEENCYDMQDKFSNEEISICISRIAYSFIRVAEYPTSTTSCIITSETGKQYSVKVFNSESMHTSSFASISDDEGTGVSDYCYAFWHKGVSEDIDYAVLNILDAVNEAYHRLAD